MAWAGTTLPLLLLTYVTEYLKCNLCQHSLGLYFERIGTVLMLPVVLTVFVFYYLRFSYRFFFLVPACTYLPSYSQVLSYVLLQWPPLEARIETKHASAHSAICTDMLNPALPIMHLCINPHSVLVAGCWHICKLDSGRGRRHRWPILLQSQRNGFP